MEGKNSGFVVRESSLCHLIKLSFYICENGMRPGLLTSEVMAEAHELS